MQKIKEMETAVIKNNNVIVMSKEELKKDIEEHLLKAEDDIRNGRVRDAREVFQEWKEKYGI
mgnify:FL=1